MPDQASALTEVALASSASAVAAASLDHSLQPSSVDSRCPKCGGIGAHLCLSQAVQLQEDVQTQPQEVIVLSESEEEDSVEVIEIPEQNVVKSAHSFRGPTRDFFQKK